MTSPRAPRDKDRPGSLPRHAVRPYPFPPTICSGGDGRRVAKDDFKIPVRPAILWAERTGVRASRKASGLAGYPKPRWPGWRDEIEPL